MSWARPSDGVDAVIQVCIQVSLPKKHMGSWHGVAWKWDWLGVIDCDVGSIGRLDGAGSEIHFTPCLSMPY